MGLFKTQFEILTHLIIIPLQDSKELLHWLCDVLQYKNPDCREAHQMYQFAQTLEGDFYSHEEGGNGDGQDDGMDWTLCTSYAHGCKNVKWRSWIIISTVHSISQVYTVEELKSTQLDKPHGGTFFSGILFAFLTSFSVDENPANVVCYRW